MASAAKRGRGVVIELSSSGEEDRDSETDSSGSQDDDDTDEELSDASSSGIGSAGSSDVEEDDDADYVADDDDEEGEELDEEVDESEEDERGKRSNFNCSGKNKQLTIKNEGDAYNNIINLLQRGKSLDGLTLEECKSYLRQHNLRISGTKLICVQRIEEHWRIKDGKGEKFYPRSSFTINCTGDVCKGDVVLFTQKVYTKFDKVTRGANVIGKRTIAGRIVKESYGAAKQQHTFTVEVLWSKGVKALSELFPLLVKGRNLYRLKTFRQRWKNENERSSILHEKHRRGAAARQTRAAAKARSVRNKGSKSKGTSNVRPMKQRKKNPKPSKADARKVQPNNPNIEKIQDGNARVRVTDSFEVPEPSRTHSRSNAQTSTYHGSFGFHHQHYASNHERHAPLVQGFLGGRGYAHTTSHVADHSRHSPWRSSYHQQMMGFPPHLPVSSMRFPAGAVNHRPCSIYGCREPATPGCVVFCCLRCCRRSRSSCYLHR